MLEIRSQSDPRRLLEAKTQLWIDKGAQFAGLLDTVEATVDIYKPSERVQSLERPEVVVGSGPVLEFELRTSHLWSHS